MATNFPGSIDSYTTKVDDVEDALASHINDPQSAIVALETKVGITGVGFNPASSSAPASVVLHEDRDNGTNKITIAAPSAVASDKVLTLPDATGTIALLEIIYPIGGLYVAASATLPAIISSIGTWVRLEGVFIVGASDTDHDFDYGDTGGSKTHTLTISQIPNVTGSVLMHNGATCTTVHSESGCFSSGGTVNKYFNQGEGIAGASSQATINFSLGGGGQAHNNLPPFKAKYMWERTA